MRTAKEPSLDERREHEKRMRLEAINGSHYDRVQYRKQEQRHRSLIDKLKSGDNAGLTQEAADKYRRRIAQGDTSW